MVACSGQTGGGTASSTSASAGWACSSDPVPNGSTVTCTTSDPRVLSAALPLENSYDCPADAPSCAQCPEETPPPPVEEYDAGAPIDTGKPKGGGGAHGKPDKSSSGGADAGEGDCDCETTPPVADAGAGGGYHCEGSGEFMTCTQVPTCAEGSHPSACGACVPNDTGEDCMPPSSGGCWVTGGGFIDAGGVNGNFGGNAMPMKSGSIRGEWEYVDHGAGPTLHGQPSYIVCRHVDEPGPGADNGPHHDFTTNQAYFGGNARLFQGGAWQDGFWFDVVVKDHGEGKGAKAGGPDTYHITVRQGANGQQPGAIVYQEEGNLVGGNIQIHPPNNGHPSTASALPTWVSLEP